MVKFEIVSKENKERHEKRLRKVATTPPDYEYGPHKIAVNTFGYLVWQTSSGRISKSKLHTTWRDWRLVKYGSGVYEYGDIGKIGNIRLPKRYIGKRIRIKIEVVDENVIPDKDEVDDNFIVENKEEEIDQVVDEDEEKKEAKKRLDDVAEIYLR